MEISEIENNPKFKELLKLSLTEKNESPLQDSGSSTYKTTTCDITGDTCYDGCCNSCHVAKKHENDEIYSDLIGLFPIVEHIKNGITLHRNYNNSFIEIDSLESLNVVMNEGWINKLKVSETLPDEIKAKYHIWNEYPEFFKDYTVKGYRYLPEYPLVIICTGRVFVEAPVVEE